MLSSWPQHELDVDDARQLTAHGVTHVFEGGLYRLLLCRPLLPHTAAAWPAKGQLRAPPDPRPAALQAPTCPAPPVP